MNNKTHKFKTVIAALIPDNYSVEDEFEVIRILQPYAKELNILLTREHRVEVILKVISEDPLVYWLNRDPQSNFSQAKNSLVKRGLVLSGTKQLTSVEDCRIKYRLEFICSAIIRFLFEHENILRQVPALKGDHKLIKRRMIYIRDELRKLGTIPFENEVWQTLFQMSLDKLLATDNRNIHSTGKWHDKIASELMCKKLMSSMCLLYHGQELSADFIINIALQTTAHLFLTTMDMKEAKKHFPKIKEDIETIIALRNKTVAELLTEYAIEQQIDY